MPSNGLFLIGTNLMVLAHVHSFVLLTANFDDVKKLAQKFVSESIAETIAEFVAKASGSKIDRTTSKEINVPKSRDQSVSDSVENEEIQGQANVKDSISKENMKYKSKKHKQRLKSKFLNASEERSSKETGKNKETNKNKENKKLDLGYKSKDNNLIYFSEDSATLNVSMESTAGYQDEKVPDKDFTSDQDEEPASDYVFRLKNGSEEGKFKADRFFTLTTRKEKIEFDQYDNTNYPKAVATSGSVTLKRLLDSPKSRYRDQNISKKNADN